MPTAALQLMVVAFKQHLLLPVVVDGAGNSTFESITINRKYLDDTNPTISSFR